MKDMAWKNFSFQIITGVLVAVYLTFAFLSTPQTIAAASIVSAANLPTPDINYFVTLSPSQPFIPTATPFIQPIFGAAIGDTTRLSLSAEGTQGNGGSFNAWFSGNSCCVAFDSYASNLVLNDTNGVEDVFIRDMASTQIIRASLSSTGDQGNGNSAYAAASSDGKFITFRSEANNLVLNDTNGVPDIFVRNIDSGQTTRISVSTGGVEGNGQSLFSVLNNDGRYVAFHSLASNLVSGDTNGVADVFYHDRFNNTTTRISTAADGTQANGFSQFPSISSDGQLIAFHSIANNLVSNDTNVAADIFVKAPLTDAIERVSISTAGVQGNNNSYNPSISSDGRYVAFESDADNLVPIDTNGVTDVFVYDRVLLTTTRVSVSSSGVQGDRASSASDISSDGRYVAFQSQATNLVSGDINGKFDVFIHDNQTGQTMRASVSTLGEQGNEDSDYPSISDDGRYVAFSSAANNLVTDDTNGLEDIFVHEQEGNTPTPTITLTPTASYTPSPTSTHTPTTVITNTATLTNTPSSTPSPTMTSSPTSTITPTVTLTNTATSTATPTLTYTPVITDTPTITLVPTSTFTPSLTYTPTLTSTPTNTNTVTPTFTVTYTPTNTSTPTMTFTPTQTYTPSMTPTMTASPTAVPVQVYSISGTVMDDQHNPLAYLAVSLNGRNMAITDSNGYYVINNLVHGTYTVSVTYEGYVFTTTVNMPLSLPRNQYNVDFIGIPQPLYSISGKVTNLKDFGLAGVTIYYGKVETNSDGDGLESGVLRIGNKQNTVVTDSVGEFTIQGLLPGKYILSITMDGYIFTPYTRSVTVPPNAIGQIFTGVPGIAINYTVSGRVLDEAGKPLPGVLIGLGSRFSAATDNLGNYSIRGVPVGYYALTATKNGYIFIPANRAVYVPRDTTFQDFKGISH